MPRLKGGRPSLPDTRKRRHSVGCRLTDDELAEAKARARSYGMQLGEFVRTAALARRMPPPPAPAINRQTSLELARAGNLCMRAIKAIEAGRVNGLSVEPFKKLWVLIQVARRDLINSRKI